MTRKKATTFFPLWVPLCFSGLYLALESGRILEPSVWHPGKVGLFVFLSAVEMLCGFLIAVIQSRRSGTFVSTIGALLLTLRAGTAHSALGVIDNFILAGGTAAFLVRNKRKNTILPFAAAFSLGLFLNSYFTDSLHFLSSLCALLLTGILILNIRGTWYGRCCFLILLAAQILLFAGDSLRLKKIFFNYRDLRTTAISLLPGSLLSQTEEDLSVLQISRSRKMLAAAPWKQLPYVSEVVSCTADQRIPLGYQLQSLKKQFDIVSLELLPEWHPSALEKLVESSARIVQPEGVLLFPRQVLKLLPAGWHFIPLPGSSGSRFAAGRKALTFEPEVLENRLQSRLAVRGEKTFITPGVFAALFQDDSPAFSRQSTGKTEAARSHTVYFYVLLAVGWLFLRLIIGRKGMRSAFLAQADNYASCTLLLLTGFCLLAGNRLYSIIPESSILWCLILLLPLAHFKTRTEKNLLLVSLILPWLLAGMEGERYFSLILCGTLFFTALSTGITAEKLMQESGAIKNQLKAAAFYGIGLGGILFNWLYEPAHVIPIITAAVLLRLSCLLRK